jgi:hypothetical protein
LRPPKTIRSCRVERAPSRAVLPNRASLRHVIGPQKCPVYAVAMDSGGSTIYLATGSGHGVGIYLTVGFVLMGFVAVFIISRRGK